MNAYKKWAGVLIVGLFFTFFNVSSVLAIVLPAPLGVWYAQNSGTTKNLYGVDFKADMTRGIAVGAQGAIRVTSDRGATWSAAASGIANTLWDVVFIPNSNIAIAVGDYGKILRSTDGGVTWVLKASGTTAQLISVSAISGAKINVTGGSGTLLESNDNGNTWRSINTGSGSDLTSVDFSDWNSNIGWILRAPAAGETSCGNENSCIFIKKTINNGLTWQYQFSPGFAEYYAIDVGHNSDSYVLVVGSNRTFLKTTDGGATWTPISIAGIPSGTHFFDIENSVIAANNGLIITSNDAGETWQVVNTGSGASFDGVAYVDNLNKWVVGSGGKIYRYDGAAPSIPGNLQLPGGSPTSDATPPFSWSASTDQESGVALYEYAVDDGGYVNIGNVTSVIIPSSLSSGQHIFYIHAVDGVGQKSDDAVLSFTISATPPTVGAVTPLSAVVGVAGVFSVTASDNDGVAQCKLYVNNAEVGVMQLADGTATLNYTFGAAGNYSLQARCTDIGQLSGSGPVSNVVVSALPPPADNNPAAQNSSVSASPNLLVADNSTASIVTVTVRNAVGVALSGKTVSLISSRGADTVTVISNITNNQGQATFSVKSSAVGVSTVIATVGGVTIGNTIVNFDIVPLLPASCPVLVAGDLVKVSGKAAIYALNSNLKVLFFPTGDEFKSWNIDNKYSGYYKTIGQECFDDLKVPAVYPAAVNFRPGSYILRKASSNQLYVVTPRNRLAKITVDDARALYGVNYKVMVVADVFWPHYTSRGEDVSGRVHEGMLIRKDSKVWYVGPGKILRQLTSRGLRENRFKDIFIRTVPASYLQGATEGVSVESEEAEMSSRVQ